MPNFKAMAVVDYFEFSFLLSLANVLCQVSSLGLYTSSYNAQ